MQFAVAQPLGLPPALYFCCATRTAASVAMSPQLPLRAACRIVKDCCAALHYIHSLGIVHRDLRSANVLLDNARSDATADARISAHVADFGLSHQLSSSVSVDDVLDSAGPGDSDGSARTAAAAAASVVTGNDALGPLLFLPPEALRRRDDGGRVTSKAGDVYMLGGLVFEVLSGGLPPYYWIPASWSAMTARDATVLLARLSAAEDGGGWVCSASGSRAVPLGAVGVGVPGSMAFQLRYRGLRGLSVVEALVADGVPHEWQVQCSCRYCTRTGSHGVSYTAAAARTMAQRSSYAAATGAATYESLSSPLASGTQYAPLASESEFAVSCGGPPSTVVTVEPDPVARVVQHGAVPPSVGMFGGDSECSGAAQLFRLMAACVTVDDSRRPSTEVLNNWMEQLLAQLPVIDAGGAAALVVPR